MRPISARHGWLHRNRAVGYGLERELPGNLHDSRKVTLNRADRAETAPADPLSVHRWSVPRIAVRSTKLRRVKGIEGIHAKSEIQPRLDRRALQQGKVDVRDGGLAHRGDLLGQSLQSPSVSLHVLYLI